MCSKSSAPGGQATREIGPFYHDQADPERSLYFWHYNFGKRGMTLDIESPRGTDLLKQLIAEADVLIDAQPPGTLEKLGLTGRPCKRSTRA